MKILHGVLFLWVWTCSGCLYATNWQTVRMDDAPWASPQDRAVWKRRTTYGIGESGGTVDHRWVNPDGKVLAEEYEPRAAQYLLSSPMAKTWPTAPSEGTPSPRKALPFSFALVSLQPMIVIFWPDQLALSFPKEVGTMKMLGAGTAFGITTLPPVEMGGLMWFSPDLNQGPMPLEKTDDTHAQIRWESGRLTLQRSDGGWRVVRE